MSSKFHRINKYSMFFAAYFKRLCSLYLIHLYQHILNSVFYIYSATRFHNTYLSGTIIMGTLKTPNLSW
jgi:hypothetical protein